jgi:predicted ester cyclase
MSEEGNKALVRRIAADIWNQGNLEVVDEVMSADARYHGPHMPNGIGDRESWRQAIAMYRNAFPDSHVKFEELIGSRDTVVGRWTATGTHTGQLPGVATTGCHIAIEGITIYAWRCLSPRAWVAASIPQLLHLPKPLHQYVGVLPHAISACHRLCHRASNSPPSHHPPQPKEAPP